MSIFTLSSNRKFTLPISKQSIWVSNKILTNVKNYLANQSLQYKNSPESDEILSNYEIDLVQTFFPKGSSKDNPIQLEDWKTSAFIKNQNYTVAGLYRVKSGLTPGVFNGLSDKFQNQHRVWILCVILFAVGLFFNPVVAILVYVFLGFLLPEKYELNDYLEFSQANPSWVDTYLIPAFCKCLGIIVMILAFGQLIYYTYLTAGFTLIRYFNWPANYVTSNLLIRPNSLGRDIVLFGLLTASLIIAYCVINLARLSYGLKLFTSKAKNTIKPLIIFGVIYLLLTSVGSPSLVNFYNNIEPTKKIFKISQMKSFSSGYSFGLGALNPAKPNLAFKKSDKSQVTIFGDQSTVNNIVIHNLGTNSPTEYQLTYNYPFQICFLCNTPTTIIIETPNLSLIKLDYDYNLVTVEGYQESQIKIENTKTTKTKVQFI